MFTAKDGKAVKWSETFKPELVKGTKASDETVTLTLDEENQVTVKHLAINEYYWQETKASEGYTLDETKYPVSIKKVDDNEKNVVITREVTAKNKSFALALISSNLPDQPLGLLKLGSMI